MCHTFASQLLEAVHLSLLFFDGFVVDVLIVRHQLVDGAGWCQFDDAVCHGVDKLVVVAGEENVALECHQVVVESLDAFQVQVVGWGVENQAVGVLQLHSGYHTSHLLAS